MLDSPVELPAKSTPPKINLSPCYGKLIDPPFRLSTRRVDWRLWDIQPVEHLPGTDFIAIGHYLAAPRALGAQVLAVACSECHTHLGLPPFDRLRRAYKIRSP